ncbi:hypothetical protein EDD18DRAFT_531526 [Armillaria luteobubalina]|uniref:Uncharacterized protein n=1 Tax=Armillaria luteobubalina TaxID=153913 RepID=A0AA39PWQ7_9AGAR|nr:hypothetical protein EDD18DRAFT_531526 [Armillaria luteobubalina]
MISTLRSQGRLSIQVLRSLRWQYYCPSSFDLLSFPALETLSVINHDNSLDGSAIRACENLIQRSKLSVHNLTLDLPVDADLRLFTLSSPIYSSITCLKMTITVTSRAADPKLVLLTDIRLLPHLTHLTTDLHTKSVAVKEWDFKAFHFNETLQVRWEHGRLKKLTILLNSGSLQFPSLDSTRRNASSAQAQWHIRLSDMRRLRTEGLGQSRFGASHILITTRASIRRKLNGENCEIGTVTWVSWSLKEKKLVGYHF